MSLSLWIFVTVVIISEMPGCLSWSLQVPEEHCRPVPAMEVRQSAQQCQTGDGAKHPPKNGPTGEHSTALFHLHSVVLGD